MKLKNKLLPIVALSGIATVATPLVVSCTNSGIAGSVFEITDGGILKGFKYGVTTSQIEKEFGDTLTIPKDVKYIVPYAFCNGEKSTIPASIKHFKFEDEYECKTIGEYAFAYAPFEDVTITCERNQPDGEMHDEGWFYRPEGGWGLETIQQFAFYDNKSLKTVKLCATYSSQSFGYRCFACSENSAIETLDFSDWVHTSSCPDAIPSNFDDMFGFNPISDWTGTFRVRWWDGIYGPEAIDAVKVNLISDWRAAWGLSSITDLSARHQLGNATMEFWGEPV